MKKLLGKLGIDGFIASLFIAIFLAWLYPYFGAKKGAFSLSTLANLGVSVIFFFYGLRLNWAKLVEGLSNVKMHVVVLAFSFFVFPVAILASMTLANARPTREDLSALQSLATSKIEERGEELDAELDANRDDNSVEIRVPQDRATSAQLWLGVFFLATLPSTVSSSVVMTNIAKGNVPAAIFDASVSSLLGVFITPVWMSIFIDANSGGRDLSSALGSLLLQVIAPVALGVFLNRFWGEYARRHEKKIGRFDQCAIVLIVYVSFCSSFAEKMFAGLSFKTLVLLTLAMIALFFGIYFMIYGVCRALKFNREDTIATLFCGSKKSLVHGVTTSRAIVAAPHLAGMLLLPTMIYHAMQLIVVSALAQRFAKSAPQTAAPDVEATVAKS